MERAPEAPSTRPLQGLASFLARLTPADVPADVMAKAKLCLTDAVACAVSARDIPWVVAARDLVMEQGGNPAASIWATPLRAPATEAAFANAVMVHGILQEDHHGQSGTHPGTIVIPAAMAMGEWLGASGALVLTAIAAGYEAMARVGSALNTAEFTPRGDRPSGVFGPFGSAAAAGILLGLNEEQMANALALAGNTGGGLRQWAHEGTHDALYHVAFASRNGATAALLARRGVTGAAGILDGKVGMFHAYAGTAERVSWVTRDLGSEWEILQVTHKPTPGCQSVHTVSQVVAALARSNQIDPDRVRRILVRTSVHGKENPGNDYPGPFETPGQAQMSNQFAVAVALLFQRSTYEEYRRYAEPRIGELARRVVVEADAEIDAWYPRKKPARVEIELEDGTVLAGYQEDTNYPTAADVREKLRILGAVAIPPARLEAILEAIESLDRMPTVAPLIARLMPE